MIKPASGLTAAYTAMVVGSRRGEAVKSRAVLTGQAYAGLRRTARRHRLGHDYPTAALVKDSKSADSELLIAPILVVLGNYYQRPFALTLP